MAYQNVGTPRFYVDIYQWLKSANLISSEQYPVSNGLNPSSIEEYHLISDNSYANWSQYAFEGGLHAMSNINYMAVLGHNLSSINGHFNLAFRVRPDDTTYYISPLYGIVNASYSNNWYPNHDGFSIVEVSPPSAPGLADGVVLRVGAEAGGVNTIAKIGSFSFGTYYNMPNAPNLSLTMSREYGGTKEFTTYNGGSMSNAMWSKPPKWGDLGAWELRGGNPAFSRSGRRVWDLKFSYLQDSDMFPVSELNMSGYNTWSWGSILTDPDEYLSGDYSVMGDGESVTFYDLMGGDTFYNQVWHKTLGGTLPFIFQPDAGVLNETTGLYEGGNNNPDQFAICKFKDSSLKATQSAFNVYDISVSIEEVW